MDTAYVLTSAFVIFILVMTVINQTKRLNWQNERIDRLIEENKELKETMFKCLGVN